MTSGVPIGIVLVDFANPALMKRLLDVGFKMANKKIKTNFPLEWFKKLELHCSLNN